MSVESVAPRRKLSERIGEQLRARIRSGEFAPGDALPSERELMRIHAVGRPAVREALQDLQRMGLVEIRHGGRARVTEPSLGPMVDQIGATMQHLLAHSPASLENLKEARLIFEVAMVRIAARKRSSSDLDRLHHVLEEQREASNDLERFVTKDGNFHREIAAISGNPIFPALSAAMFQWLADFYRGAVSVPGLEQLTLKEHGDILAAIEARDPEAAARHMTDHQTRANELYRRQNFAAQS